MDWTDIDSSEREEGEIVDDLEEISDDSIAPSPKTGKFHSPEENLRAISLSSVSDVDVVHSCSSVRKSDQKKHRRSETRKRKRSLRHHRRRSSGSSSEDEDMARTKKMLREAMSRDHEEMHNNSLRTRLKKMVENSLLPQELDIECLDCDNHDTVISEPTIIPNNEKIDDINKEVLVEEESCNKYRVDVDDELIQLRLEALKTAVINKFQRKKRKIKSVDQEETTTQEVNKENSPVNLNSQGTSENVPEVAESNPLVNNTAPDSAMNSEEEVDEDILRAVLLASMAEKITQKVNVKKTKDVNIVKNIHKKPIKPSQPSSKTHIEPPKIQPIIISINNPDSDSDDEFNDTVCSLDSKEEKDKEIEMKIDSFLKEQREAVEAKTIVNIPNPSPNKFKTEVVKINSLYKLLPRKKQLEYVGLIQRLNSAEKRKTRVRRVSCRLTDNKVQKNKVSSKTCENNLIKDSNSSGSQQKQLRHVQQQVNGRLQDKTKYHELSPLLKKMEQVNVEQKKHEILIGQLLKQLNEARLESSKLQNVFNELMQDFLKKKEEIDRNTKVVPVPKPVATQNPNVAPLKPTPKVAETKPTPKVAETKPTPRVTDAKSTPQVTVPKPTPIITTPKPTPKVTISKPTPKPTVFKPTQNVVVAKPIPKSNASKPTQNVVVAKPTQKLTASKPPLNVVAKAIPKSVASNPTQSVVVVKPTPKVAVSNPTPRVAVSKSTAISVSNCAPKVLDSKQIPNAKQKVDSQNSSDPLPSKNGLPNPFNNTMQCKVILEKCPVNLEDPNDIEFKTLTKMENCDLPKYSSPLDYMESKNQKILNPMGILCPYDMDGVCRDKDCTYNHCR